MLALGTDGGDLALAADGVAREDHPAVLQGEPLDERARSQPIQERLGTHRPQRLAVHDHRRQLDRASVVEVVVQTMPVPGRCPVSHQVDGGEESLEGGHRVGHLERRRRDGGTDHRGSSG
jgi:hypothetical protein